MECNHVYGVLSGYPVNADNYVSDSDIDVKFTYCPYCRTQVHTLDGVPLGIQPVDDDCIKRGCAD